MVLCAGCSLGTSLQRRRWVRLAPLRHTGDVDGLLGGSTKRAERCSWLVPHRVLQAVRKVRELARTKGHWALPVPFQLPPTGTAGEDRQGIAAGLPPGAGNIFLCSTDGSGAQLFVMVREIREAALVMLF